MKQPNKQSPEILPKHAVTTPLKTAPKRKRKMTEDERIRASNNFERRLQKMDAERLQKFDPRKIDWALLLLVAMAVFCVFYFLR
uniref:Uncharacterized protein n=1 Tax=Myoviridae sp. ctHaT25 TaxID=2826635 RepID=A0A8S5N9Q3_9CAUD|nr:MAG TPA: hypothetical protein [Myoviridae sp. ctHaT25]